MIATVGLCTKSSIIHDINNVTDSGCHCVSAKHSARDVGSGSVASSSELFTVVRPSI